MPRHRRRRDDAQSLEELARAQRPIAGAVGDGHDATPAVAAPGPAGPVPGAPAAQRAGTLAQLQRTAGNAAVQRSLGSLADAATTAERGGPPVVQRADPTTEERPVAVELHPEDIVFTRLPPGRGFMSGTGRNTSAARVHELVLESHEVSTEAKAILGYLDWTEHEASGRDLAAVEGAAPMIAARSRGAKGDRLRASIEGYTQANPKLAGQVDELTAARAEVEAATAGVDKALTDQELTAASRASEAAAAEVAAQTAKIEKQKKWANKIFEGVIDLVFDPKKVTDVVKGLVKFAGSELLVGPLVEGAHAARTAELREKLTAAKRRVSNLQDERDLLAVEQAVKTLEAARATYRSKLNALVAATREAEAEYATLVETLEGMGKAGAAAAGALDARALAAEQGAAALERLLSYEQLLAKVRKAAKDLAVSYENYAGMASSPGGTQYVADEMLRSQLWMIADTNADKADKIARWAASELLTTEAAKAYVTSGSYLQTYERIDSVLHEAIVHR